MLLTEILRIYLDRRYHISSLEMTSFETLECLYKNGFEKDVNYDLLDQLFKLADLSKFAKYKPADTINIKALEDARLFVKNTFLKSDEEKIVKKLVKGEEAINE